MKSASVVKITSGASARNLVDYNQQESKVTGQWRKQDGEYQPTELLKYVGDQSKPYLSLDEQGQYFVANAKGNLDLSRKIGQAAKIKSSEVHTIIQSFDYQINPELTPGEANQMGIEYFAAIQDYLKDKYNYELDLGMVSTHIDRSEIKMSATNLGKVNYPHLHNHIVIPSYNAQGVNIAPYLRKENIYAFKDLNDKIVDNHNLKDLSFCKTAA
jgi:Relaxase/Mobilisation nuclease domain.